MLDEKDIATLSNLLTEQATRIDSRVASTIADAKKDIMQSVAVLIESEITPKFNLLAEGQQDIIKRLDKIESTLADHTEKLNVLENWTKEAAVTIKVPYIPTK